MEEFFYSSAVGIPASFNLREIRIEGHTPTITDRDVREGVILRYFARPANHTDGEIIEISRSTYTRILHNSLYTVVELAWRIAGDIDDSPVDPYNKVRLYTGVRTANRLSLEVADEVLPGMVRQITNLLQYYQSV